jgi:regulator of sigma D
METTDLMPLLLRNLRAEIDARFTHVHLRFEHVYGQLEHHVLHEHFHDAMLALGKNVERTHARMIDADIRAFTAQREHQYLLGRIQEYLDARFNLEDRVARCEADLDHLKRRAP